MTVPLDRADKQIILIAAGVLVALSVVALLVPNARQQSLTGFPSSYSTARDGAKAAYTLLEETGYKVERWTQSPADLLPLRGNTVLIIAGPTIPATTEEVRALKQFVSEGGRVLVTGMLSAAMVGANGVGPTAADPDEWHTFAAEQPAPLTLHAPDISMQSSIRWIHPLPGEQRYYGDGEGAAVVKFQFGDGTVVWWAGDSPLTNSGITRDANLALFLNSVGPPGRTRVLWDEYFHGVRLGLWHYLGHTPLPWALVQILALAVFIIFTYSRRSGVLRPMTRESRLSPLEFVSTLGGLYERRGEAAGALEIAYSHFRFLVTRRLGIPSTVPTADLIQRVQARPGWSVPGLAETMEQIDSALKLQKVTETKALAWIGELYGFAARLGLVP